MEWIKGKQIKEGGEGFIFEVEGRPDLLMKVYKEKDSQGQPILTSELINKLMYMAENPPKVLVDDGVIAWPTELVYEQGKVIGFIMPKLVFDTQLLQLYAYKHPYYDKSSYDTFPSVKSRIGIAINLASAINQLHSYGYIVGDMNHENIGIDRRSGSINIVDCDSFHIVDKKGNIMRTNVVMPGYLAPEIIAHCSEERAAGRPYTIDKVALPTFTVESDLFCLAVHIFKLLMNGVDPFKGVLDYTTGSAATPFLGNEAVERNTYLFKEGYRPSAVFCLSPNEIPAELITLFDEAFIDGHNNPYLRPTAEMWYNALFKYYGLLTECPRNEKHSYYRVLKTCPFCEADDRYSAVLSQTVPFTPIQSGGIPRNGDNIGGAGMSAQIVTSAESKTLKWTLIIVGAIIATVFLMFLFIYFLVYPYKIESHTEIPPLNDYVVSTSEVLYTGPEAYEPNIDLIYRHT